MAWPMTAGTAMPTSIEAREGFASCLLGVPALAAALALVLASGGCGPESLEEAAASIGNSREASNPATDIEMAAGPGTLSLHLERTHVDDRALLSIQTTLRLSEPGGERRVEYEQRWDLVDPESAMPLDLVAADRLMYQVSTVEAVSWGEVLLSTSPQLLVKSVRVEGAGEERSWYGADQ